MRSKDEKIIIGILELAKIGFYAELKKKFRILIREKVYKKFGSLKNFSVQTGIISNCYLSSILTGGYYTKLSLWLKICRALNISLRQLKENVLKIRAKHAKFFLKPEQLPILPSPELASLVGHGLGDGHISKEGCFEYTNRQASLHTEVSRIIYRIFNGSKYTEIDVKNTRWRRRYNVIVGETLHLLGVPKVNKITQSFPVPDWILNGSKEVKKSFIRALFDDEGTVKVSGHEILIKFSKNERYLGSLRKFMEQIKQLLENLGIKVTSIRKGNIVFGKNGRTIQLVLGIHGYRNFIRFLEEIGFSHKQKQKKLAKIINSYKSFQNRKGETQRMLYENLFKSLTIYDLMNNLNMSYMTVYKSIKKLEKQGLVAGIEYSKKQPIIWKKLK